MLVLSTALTAFIALLFIYLFMPTVWMSFFDDSDAHESGLAAVAARNPFRETGPPANMAKLILLRQKIQSSSRKRRSLSHTRQTSRSYTKIPVVTKARSPWIRFGRSLAGKQYH
ncbi:hypothetical protein C8J56DRAFT_858998 [Mycena floridula]|nr:hypothetical protein C8J56DRAFT_858998 [Mycena floridula]